MEDLMHVPIRLMQLISRAIYEFNREKNEWVLVSKDTPVTEQFNQWAEEQKVNPHQHSITVRNYKEDDRFVIETILCVSVIGRKEQAMMELAYRQKLQELLNASVNSETDVPKQEPFMETINSAVEQKEGGVIERTTFPLTPEG